MLYTKRFPTTALEAEQFVVEVNQSSNLQELAFQYDFINNYYKNRIACYPFPYPLVDTEEEKADSINWANNEAYRIKRAFSGSEAQMGMMRDDLVRVIEQRIISILAESINLSREECVEIWLFSCKKVRDEKVNCIVNCFMDIAKLYEKLLWLKDEVYFGQSKETDDDGWLD